MKFPFIILNLSNLTTIILIIILFLIKTMLRFNRQLKPSGQAKASIRNYRTYDNNCEFSFYGASVPHICESIVICAHLGGYILRLRANLSHGSPLSTKMADQNFLQKFSNGVKMLKKRFSCDLKDLKITRRIPVNEFLSEEMEEAMEDFMFKTFLGV